VPCQRFFVLSDSGVPRTFVDDCRLRALLEPAISMDVEYLKDSGCIPDFHYQLESFIRLQNDNYAAAFHYHKQLACITFAK